MVKTLSLERLSPGGGSQNRGESAPSDYDCSIGSTQALAPLWDPPQAPARGRKLSGVVSKPSRPMQNSHTVRQKDRGIACQTPRYRSVASALRLEVLAADGDELVRLRIAVEPLTERRKIVRASIVGDASERSRFEFIV